VIEAMAPKHRSSPHKCRAERSGLVDRALDSGDRGLGS